MQPGKAGEVFPIANASAMGSYSPDDGSRIAFWSDNGFWIMKANGDAKQELIRLDSKYEYRSLKWSPDAQRVAYLKIDSSSGKGWIESLKPGEKPAPLFEADGLLDFWWTNGRLIYTQVGPSGQTYDLKDVGVDSDAATTKGEPRVLKSWDGSSSGFVSASNDGKRIVTIKDNEQSDVYVADIASNGLLSERSLTSDRRSDWPGSFAGNEEILLFSDRNQGFNIFRQSVSGPKTESVVPGKTDARAPQISPDGKWLLYMVWSETEPVRIWRKPLVSGVADVVIEARGSSKNGTNFSADGRLDLKKRGPKNFPDFRCPSQGSAPCVLAEAEQNEILFTPFDPEQKTRVGEPRRVSASPAKFFWDLSPDGSQAAYGEFKSETDDHITIITLSDGKTREVALGDWTALSSIAWSAGGRDLFATTYRLEGSDLLRVSLEGDVKRLLERTGRWFINPRPSPDGKRLAFGVRTIDSNVWLIDLN